MKCRTYLLIGCSIQVLIWAVAIGYLWQLTSDFQFSLQTSGTSDLQAAGIAQTPQSMSGLCLVIAPPRSEGIRTAIHECIYMGLNYTRPKHIEFNIKVLAYLQ